MLICYDREDDDTLPAFRDNCEALGKPGDRFRAQLSHLTQLPTRESSNGFDYFFAAHDR
jgi:hypothetical protein